MCFVAWQRVVQITLFFDKNPLFQASLCILILFVAYLLHCHYQPFLPIQAISQSFLNRT